MHESSNVSGTTWSASIDPGLKTAWNRVAVSLGQWRAFDTLGTCSLNACARKVYVESWWPAWSCLEMRFYENAVMSTYTHLYDIKSIFPKWARKYGICMNLTYFFKITAGICFPTSISICSTVVRRIRQVPAPRFLYRFIGSWTPGFIVFDGFCT